MAFLKPPDVDLAPLSLLTEDGNLKHVVPAKEGRLWPQLASGASGTFANHRSSIQPRAPWIKGESMRYILERSVATALLLITLPSSAHHSYTPYDLERTVALEGVVTKFLWANPHVYIDLRTEKKGDEYATWTIESLGPQALRNLGWSASSLAAGDQVIATVYPPRNPNRKIAFGSSVLKVDGTLLSMPHLRNRTPASENPTTPFVAGDLSGRWRGQFDLSAVQSFIPPLALPLTDRGIAAAESFDPNRDIPGRDCMSFTVPYTMFFTGVAEIDLGDEVVSIRGGGIERTIHLDIDSHDGAPLGYQGHSIGRWEDGVLVVDTTRFADHRSGNAFGLPSGSQKHLIERFVLSPDNTRFTYTFTLEDPEYLSEPVTVTLEFRYRPDLPFESIPCNLESARRYLEFIEE
jgi:hypothetical protein